jgi:hypothetical protein
MEKPSGVVAILTAPNGVVMASVIDCEPEKSGHATIAEGQEYRARHALSDAMLRAMCNHDIAEVMSGYQSLEIMRSLVRTKGYRVTTIDLSDCRTL